MIFKDTTKLIKNIIISARPRQWLKNLSLFAAVTFWGTFFDPVIFIKVAKAVLIFCGLSSSMYLLNDIFDAPKDRLHPTKKERPIASHELSPKVAALISLLLILILLPLSFQLNKFFFVLCFSFIILQLLYTLILRDVIIMDAMTVATGFIFRVYAGALVVNTPISAWLILSTIGLALLLAFGKRRSEKNLLKTRGIEEKTRITLEHYPDSLLDSMISVSASLTLVSYVLFAFQTSPTETIPPLLPYLPVTLAKPKWMLLTIPLVIYGVARYLFVIYERKEGESPEKILLSDFALLSTIILWWVSVITIIYGVGR